jgi:apolipoprotein N-acyltransferase
MTLEAAASSPSLVVWPSSSVPGVIPVDVAMMARIGGIAKKGNVHLLVGAAGLDKFNQEQVKSKRVANSAFLFSPEGRIMGRYDKIHLLPFDEYLPARGYIPWPTWIVEPGMTDHYPGTNLTLFNVGGARFGVQICFENMFPEQIRALVNRGADFIVGQTNELWTKSEVGQRQLLAFYVFRAIENRVPLVRCSTNGISCFIDAKGKITGSIHDASGNETGVPGMSVNEIRLGADRSFYSRFGDIFALTSVSILLILLPAGAFLQKKMSRQLLYTEGCI